MTETLAAHLAAALAAALPFLAPEVGGRAVGLARLYLKQEQQDDDRPVPLKLPVPVTFTAAECESADRYLLPDLRTPAVLFFEDGGSQALTSSQYQPSQGYRTATLGLRLWVNAPLLTGPLTEAALLAALDAVLRPGHRFQLPPLADVVLSYQVLPAEASLYGRYSFSEAGVTELLLPPYRVVGFSITAQYRVLRGCPEAVLPGAREGGGVCL